MRKESRQVSRIWFPVEHGQFFVLPNGSNANVLIGEPAYQVSDGEITTL